LGNSLFGTHESIKPVRPEIPVAMEVDKMELLKRERELVGMFLSAHPLDQYRFEIKTFTSNTIGEAAELASQALQDSSLRGKEMIIAGMVTNSKSSVTKTGRPFVSFSVEDFNGTIQFSLFGKDYENFMKYTHPGTPLLIKVAILQKYGFQNNGDDSAKQVDCELKVRSMRLLSNTREDFIKSITLSLPVSMITKNLRRDLTNIFKENKGSTRVVVKILDYETQISVEFVSIKYSVALTDVLLNYLEANGIEWSITPTLSF
jgi:DNA polymerase-3 subunit alpha